MIQQRVMGTAPANGHRVRRELDLFTRVLHKKAAYVLVGLAGLALHLTLARPIYAWYDRLGAWVPLVILLLAIYKYVRQRRRTFPILLLGALQIYLFYSVPQFTQETIYLHSGVYSPTAFAVTSAVMLVMAGELAFFAGYQVTVAAGTSRVAIFDKILPTPTPRWSGPLTFYAVPSLAIHALIALRPEYIPVSTRMLLSQFFNVYLSLVIMLFLGYRFGVGRMRVMAFLSIVAMSFTGFVQGVMGHIINPVLILFAANWLWGGAIKKRWVVVVVATILIINPVKNHFRYMEYSERDVASFDLMGQRLNSWKVSFEQVWTDNRTEVNLLQTASRTNDLISFAQVVDYVPTLIPYNHGEGMAVVLVYWIPRIFWPSKPSSTDLLFNRYAVEFGYATEESTRSSTMGASTYTEGYWNFGAIGVVLFLVATGVLLGFFFGNNGLHGDVSAIIAMVYYASVMLLIQPLTVTASSLITFTAGVWVAMHGLHRLSGSQQAHRQHVVRSRPLLSAHAPGHLPDASGYEGELRRRTVK